jgi:hypothetical protein
MIATTCTFVKAKAMQEFTEEQREAYQKELEKTRVDLYCGRTFTLTGSSHAKRSEFALGVCDRLLRGAGGFAGLADTYFNPQNSNLSKHTGVAL